MTRADKPLAGVTVLVTRPAGLGGDLCRAVEDAGGKAVQFPAMEIEPLTGKPVREALRRAVADCSGILFVSRNAVACALSLLDDPGGALAGRTVFAAGPGTRRALHEGGVDGVICPDSTRASEELLALPELAPDRVAGMDIAVIRGEGGRELLLGELQRRGARVRVVEVYRRAAPSVAPEQVHALWREMRPDIIVITSAAGLYNLVKITAAEDRPVLLRSGLVVMSGRIAEAAGELGFERQPQVAAAASDAGLIQAVVACTELMKNDR
jgi:uroporphyrinogen-III synthase